MASERRGYFNIYACCMKNQLPCLSYSNTPLYMFRKISVVSFFKIEFMQILPVVTLYVCLWYSSHYTNAPKRRLVLALSTSSTRLLPDK